MTQFGREDELPATENGRRIEAHGGALVRHVELGQAVHLVAEQIDADAGVAGGRKDVDDPPPYGYLASVFDLVLAPVTGSNQALDQLARIERVAEADDHRLGVGNRRAEPLQQRLHGGNENPAPSAVVVGRRRCAVSQVPHRLQAPAHRLDARADSLEGQRLPGGKQVDCHPPGERTEIVGEMLRLARRGRRHEQER